MQDRATGDMIPLWVQNYDEPTQADKDAAIPDRSRQGVVLRVGQEVDINGGRFRVASIGKKLLVLEGLPGTFAQEG